MISQSLFLFSHLAVTLIAFAGVFVCAHIYHHKITKKPLICPFKANCDEVVASKYSKFLGIHIEFFGLAFYLIIGLYHLFVMFFPEFVLPIFGSITLAISFLSIIFSVYLALAQAWVLKKWCSWCMFSTLLCLIIFVFRICGI